MILKEEKKQFFAWRKFKYSQKIVSKNYFMMEKMLDCLMIVMKLGSEHKHVSNYVPS